MNFLTKSLSFACVPTHTSLPPTYALPLPAPPNTEFPTHNAFTIPTEISAQFINVLSNFTTSLTTFACGRDWYSSPSDPTLLSRNPGPSDSPTRAQHLHPLLPVSKYSPPSFQYPPHNHPLTALIFLMSSPYTQLLPCIETCTSVDRACPPFLGFRCPSVMFNGASSYGFGYIDGAEGDERGGVAGVAQDRWGNIWCNAG
ncbi:hypothetical protein P691DRAFT_506442 [Macrolepiota fuliginosa MF-IS2]|uniref:FZ domain-containing protein n=1 Tax=Macrolepiota fuliginosa MF-IS2 TaxID=1400762 RepID=A0A9P5X3E0_9AGAR|nr:hypothetical protein P691DRAFT_506442 [Macrolepiota fuliginosa MF-IS2]